MAPSLKLIVEVDGGYHSQRVIADAKRVVGDDARCALVVEWLVYRQSRSDEEVS